MPALRGAETEVPAFDFRHRTGATATALIHLRSDHRGIDLISMR